MQVLPISNKNNSSSFKGVRYQNGIKTKNVLDDNIKRILRFIELKCENIKNVDLILSDSGRLQLDIKTPRYLNSKFNRFYSEENYNLGFNDRDDNIGKYHYLMNTKKNEYLGIRLQLTEEPGIYNVLGNSPESKSDFGKILSNTLEAAELIDKVSNKIKTAEQNYGMDCINVLNNMDELTLEAERTKLVDEIKESYVLLNDSEKKLEKWDLKDLYMLADNKANVENIKHYKVALVGNIYNHGASSELVDENGYLDEIYKEFYEKEGLKIENRNSFVRYILPLNGEYPKYSFGSKDGKTYGVWMDTYEMGSNLSSMSNSHFKMFLEIANRLDNIADSIEKYLKTNI